MIITGTGPGASGVAVLARVLGNDGQPVTRATVASVAWTATDLTAGAVVGTGTFAVASSVFDALQQQATDPRWTLDTPARPGADGRSGYNFLGVVPAATFALSAPAALAPGYPPPAPHRYQIDVAFTPVAGEPFRLTGFFTPESQVFG